jgi:hypothetical protein
MMSKETTVYWAPQVTWEVGGLGEWSMLYPEPTNLFNDLAKLRQPNAGTKTFLSCPSSSKEFRNSFVFKNELDSHYAYDFTDDKQDLFPVSQTYLNAEVRRNPTISTGPLININLYYIFFAEESLTASFTPPMMHEPNYTKYGTVIPGKFDIGQWFRPYPLEMQMWHDKGELILKEDEPLFYVNFETDQKINLKRFKYNATLHSYADHCSNTAKVWGMGVPLEKRYQRFKQSKMREMVLKEIKQNLLD